MIGFSGRWKMVGIGGDGSIRHGAGRVVDESRADVRGTLGSRAGRELEGGSAYAGILQRRQAGEDLGFRFRRAPRQCDGGWERSNGGGGVGVWLGAERPPEGWGRVEPELRPRLP